MSDLSPLQKYCEKMDVNYLDYSYMQLYYEIALDVDTVVFSNMFIKEIYWRADHQLNCLGSIEAEQGYGKSLFGCDLSIRTGKAYDEPFIFERDIFTNPFMLEKELRFSGSTRRTFFYDEQPQRKVGIGSVSTQISLKDYEEIARYDQNNIYSASPEIQDHAHYFVFKQVNYNTDRISNEVCMKCEKYAECHKQFYSTMCEITFSERDGYPKSFSFMLETKRLSDKLFIPRGVVTLPMLAPESAKKYNSVKKKNIVNFNKFKSNYWNDIKEELNKFIVKFKNDLIKITSKKLYAPKPLKQIEFYFYDHFSTERFTKSQVEVFLPVIQDKVALLCNEKNNNKEALNNSVKGV